MSRLRRSFGTCRLYKLEMCRTQIRWHIPRSKCHLKYRDLIMRAWKVYTACAGQRTVSLSSARRCAREVFVEKGSASQLTAAQLECIPLKLCDTRWRSFASAPLLMRLITTSPYLRISSRLAQLRSRRRNLNASIRMRPSPQQPSHKSHSKAEEEKGHDFGAHEHTLTYQHTHHAVSAEAPAEAGESTRGSEVTKLSINKQNIFLRGGRGVHHFTRGACYLELVGPREVIIGQNNNESAGHWSLP